MGILQSFSNFIKTTNSNNTAGAGQIVTGMSLVGDFRSLHVTPVSDGFLDLIQPSLAASLTMTAGRFVHQFTIPSALIRAGGSGFLQQIIAIDKQAPQAQKPGLDFWIGGARASITSAPGATLTMATTQLRNFVQVAPLLSGSQREAGLGSLLQLGQLGILVRNFESVPTAHLHCLVVANNTWTTIQDQFEYRFGVLPL